MCLSKPRRRMKPYFCKDWPYLPNFHLFITFLVAQLEDLRKWSVQTQWQFEEHFCEQPAVDCTESKWNINSSCSWTILVVVSGEWHLVWANTFKLKISTYIGVVQNGAHPHQKSTKIRNQSLSFTYEGCDIISLLRGRVKTGHCIFKLLIGIHVTL